MKIKRTSSTLNSLFVVNMIVCSATALFVGLRANGNTVTESCFEDEAVVQVSKTLPNSGLSIGEYYCAPVDDLRTLRKAE